MHRRTFLPDLKRRERRMLARHVPAQVLEGAIAAGADASLGPLRDPRRVAFVAVGAVAFALRFLTQLLVAARIQPRYQEMSRPIR